MADNPYVKLSESSSEGEEKPRRSSISSLNPLEPFRKLAKSFKMKKVEPPSNELDLTKLEIIQIEDSDEEDTHNPSITTTNQSELPYFDFLPDEVVYHLFNMLNERDMGRFALTCVRFLSFLDFPDIWHNKAQNWTTLTIERGKDRKYYRDQFIKNEKQEKEQREREKQEGKRIAWENFLRRAGDFSNNVFFNYRCFDLPILITLPIWTILMALREDEIILWNYDWIFSLVFLAHVYVLIAGIIVFPLFKALQQANIHLTYNQTLLSFFGKEQLMGAFLIIGFPWLLTWSTFLAYLISISSEGAISLNWALFPIALFSTIALFLCFCACIIECNKSDMMGYFFMFVIYLFFAWLFSFVASKTEFYLDITWGVTFVPIWIILGGLFIVYCMSAIAIFTDNNDHEGQRIFRMMSILLVPGYFSFLAWFIVLTKNLEAMDYDQPMYPWIVVHIPVLITQICAIIGAGIILHNVPQI